MPVPPFLKLVAHDLFNKLGSDLSHTVVIFPNKRASLFFNTYLAAEANRPMWAPNYLSISDLFCQLSDLRPGDPVRLVCLLYRVFCQETGSTETLDDFYAWGEMLISDFDDVDKNLVDAARLFGNLQDLHEIDDNYDFLDEEQKKAIHHFFQNFSPEKRTYLKERFLSLWNKLGSIYQRYKEVLLNNGIGYEGLMYRRAMEHLELRSLRYEHYVFVGFNVLSKVETALFQRLQDAGKALFYWDYDIFYTCLPHEQALPYTHEAGEFILRNMKLFPNQLPETYFDTMRTSKQVHYISSPTENAQARFLTDALSANEYHEANNWIDTAIVLCNESLLLPVIHAIPTAIKDINITMGFPLAQTPVYSFINALMALQTTGYHAKNGRYTYEAVATVLRHPYTRLCSERTEELERRLTTNNRFYPTPAELQADDFLGKVFAPQQTTSELCNYLANLLRETAGIYRQDENQATTDLYNQLYRESLFKSYTIVNRLCNLIETGELTLRPLTLTRLIERLLTSASIPFHGEPAIGLQVMGVLETRNLDFRNLFILSLNEGQLPKEGGNSSFIPYNLRKAFGMTTIEHKNAVYAYYFYRLMQRAEHVYLLYNTSTDGLNRGEMSRFMLQFRVEWPHEISLQHLTADQMPQSPRELCIEKTPQLLQRLRERFDTRYHPHALFSPSALNAYLDCQLQFYFRYVLGLQEAEEVSTEIDSALFGTIFHRVAETVYKALTVNGSEVRKEDIATFLDNPTRIQTLVDNAFKENLFHITSDEKPEYNGTQLIHAQVICSYIRQLLRIDQRYAPFHLEHSEYTVSEPVYLDTEEGQIPINIGGTIDRIDRKNDLLRIVDYKTGGMPKTAEDIEQLFTPAENRPRHILQTFFYAAILSRKQPLPVTPALLYIHKAASADYSPVIELGSRQGKQTVTDFRRYEAEFRNCLQNTLQEIFCLPTSFVQTSNTGLCAYCSYRKLCKR